MPHRILFSFAVAFLSSLNIAGLSLPTQVDQDKHDISLHHHFDDEEGTFISLMSHDVVLSKPTPVSERAEIAHLRLYEMMFWIVGLCLGLIGQSVVAVGYLIQKMAQDKLAIEDASCDDSGCNPSQSRDLLRESPSKHVHDVEQEDYENYDSLEVALEGARRKSSAALADVGGGHFTDRLWWMGLVVFLCGHIFCWMALGFAPQPVLACLQSWNMVVVMLLGPRMVNERLPENAFRYCSLIILGCIIVVACGPQESGSIAVNMEDLELDMYHWYWIFPVVGSMLLMILAHAANVQPAYVFILLSAVCAWYAATLAKVTAVLAFLDVFYAGGVGFGLFLIFVVFFTLALFQIHFMNMALRHGEATLVIPLYEALSMIGNIVFGAVFWHDFYGIGVARFTGFVFGVGIIVSGLTFLTYGKKTIEYEIASARRQESESSRVGSDC